MPQVAGAVLATITGSAAASWFGVAGTLIGAGVLSLASTVGGAIYSYHLRRTAERLEVVRARMGRRTRRENVGNGEGPVPEGPGPESDTVEIDRSRINAEPEKTQPLKATAEDTALHADTAVQKADERAAARWRPRWLVVAGLAAAVFAATMLLIFGFEALMGGSVSSVLHGKPDGGTTLFQNQNAEAPIPGDTTGTPAPEETGREETQGPDAPESPDPTDPGPTYPEPTEPIPTQQPTEQEPPDQQQDQPGLNDQPEPRTQPSG